MINQIYNTMKKNHITIKRAYPFSFIFGRIVEAVYIILFSYFTYFYMFNKTTNMSFYKYSNTTNYMGYIVIGTTINILFVAIIMNVGRSLITELREGTLEVILISPCSRIGYYLGCLFEQLGRTLFECVLIFILGLILGAVFVNLNIFSLIIIISLATVSFFSMSLLISVIMLYTRDTYIVQNTLFCLVFILCGISFPIQFLPKACQFLSYIFPLTYLISMARNTFILGADLHSQISLVLKVLILSCVYCFLGIILLKRTEKIVFEKIFS